jgi:hypothetical protein
LNAVIKAQAQAALTTASFIKSVGIDENNTVINVAFNYNITNSTTGQRQENTLLVPFLSIIPIPFLRVSVPALG